MTVAEKNDYVRHMENLRYQRSVIKTGYDDGWQKGLADGRAEGLAEGENKANIATAQRLLAMGLSTDQVSAATQLPLEHIEKLKSSLDTK